MSGYSDLLEFLKQQQKGKRLLQFLEEKGYANPQQDCFGLNQWTNRLTVERSDTQKENQDPVKRPDHLVSFLSIPDCCQEECINTNAEGFQHWVSGYQWKNIPGINYPFIEGTVRACSEGLLLPKWIESSDKGRLEAFLLIRRDGICEYGVGRNAYYLHENDAVFQLIYIVGRLWQFLLYTNGLHETFLKDRNPGTTIIVNLRGTKDALIGDLAEGWNEPFGRSYDPYRPRCYDQHLQIQRKISSGMTENDVMEIIRWFATRIDNAWGQFEPRCYVHKNVDETTPFALRKR